MKDSLIMALHRIEHETYAVQINKYSGHSLIGDCKELNSWLHEYGFFYPLKRKLSDIPLYIWRCRIGRNPWHHGWSMEEAIIAAVSELEGKENGTNT